MDRLWKYAHYYTNVKGPLYILKVSLTGRPSYSATPTLIYLTFIRGVAPGSWRG